MKHLLLYLAIAFPGMILANEPDAVAQQEIAHLISQLGSSGCQFNRNGSWYAPSEAVSHLKQKYDYLLKRSLVPNAEAFIARAASGSSVSGQPYLVKCDGNPPVTSAVWLRAELAKFRKKSRDMGKQR